MLNVKLNNEQEIPVLGLGVFLISNNEKCAQNVEMALKEGYRLIDTAASYGNERGVGEGIKKAGVKREDIFITSKLWLSDYGYDKAKKAIDTSLRKLGLDYMDMYLLHQPHGDNIGSYKALEEAVKAGKIKSIGVCNHSVEQLKNLIQNISIIPAVNQVECHPYFQQKELRAFMDKYKIRLESWYPLAHGNKKLLNDPQMIAIAERYKKNIGQIILRWHVQEGFIAIPKAASEKNLKGNLNIFDFELTSQEMQIIRSLDKNKRLSINPENKFMGFLMKMIKVKD